MRPWETVDTPTSQARVHKITKCCPLNGVPRMLQNFMCHKWASVPLQTFSQVADMGVAMTSLHALTTCCDPVHMEKQLETFEGRYRPVSRSVYCTRCSATKKTQSHCWKIMWPPFASLACRLSDNTFQPNHFRISKWCEMWFYVFFHPWLCLLSQSWVGHLLNFWGNASGYTFKPQRNALLESRWTIELQRLAMLSESPVTAARQKKGKQMKTACCCHQALKSLTCKKNI